MSSIAHQLQPQQQCPLYQQHLQQQQVYFAPKEAQGKAASSGITLHSMGSKDWVKITHRSEINSNI